jgi:hypothetical protein
MIYTPRACSGEQIRRGIYPQGITALYKKSKVEAKGDISPGVTWGLIPQSLTEQALSCESNSKR